MPLSAQSRGVYVVAVTPFTETLEIDFDGLDRLTDFYLEAGVDGITVLGMMGEAPRLTRDEAGAVVKRVVSRAGNIPVVVGVSAAGFPAMGGLAREVMDIGAAGVMVAPAATKTDRQIKDYYAGAVAAIGEDVPMVLQDFPLATGIQIDAATMVDIIASHPSIVMLKHEDWPGLNKITYLRTHQDKFAQGLSILCGNGGIFLPEELARGADGAMTGFAFPEMMVEVCRLYQEGNADHAQDIFDAYLPLVRYEQQPGLGLAVRKHTLWKRGVLKTPLQRRPGGTLSAADILDVERLLARQEQRLKEFN